MQRFRCILFEVCILIFVDTSDSKVLRESTIVSKADVESSRASLNVAKASAVPSPMLSASSQSSPKNLSTWHSDRSNDVVSGTKMIHLHGNAAHVETPEPLLSFLSLKLENWGSRTGNCSVPVPGSDELTQSKQSQFRRFLLREVPSPIQSFMSQWPRWSTRRHLLVSVIALLSFAIILKFLCSSRPNRNGDDQDITAKEGWQRIPIQPHRLAHLSEDYTWTTQVSSVDERVEIWNTGPNAEHFDIGKPGMSDTSEVASPDEKVEYFDISDGESEDVSTCFDEGQPDIDKCSAFEPEQSFCSTMSSAMSDLQFEFASPMLDGRQGPSLASELEADCDSHLKDVQQHQPSSLNARDTKNVKAKSEADAASPEPEAEPEASLDSVWFGLGTLDLFMETLGSVVSRARRPASGQSTTG